MVESRGESRVATRVESMVGSMVESRGRCIRQRVRGRVRDRGRNGRVDPLTSWPVGRGSAFGNGVRHIIAARDEARPHALAADQRGRWSLPERMVFASGWGLAVGGLSMRLQVHSVLRTLSSVLCLFQVRLTVLGRPEGGRVDLLTSGPVGKGNRRGKAWGQAHGAAPGRARRLGVGG